MISLATALARHFSFLTAINLNKSSLGFLANLATLLNDAEVMSKKNSGINNASSTMTALQETTNVQKDEHATVKSLTETKTKDNNEEPTPSVGSVESSLKVEGKESAPIFALFHGKIVPLGKLPDSSFKKSHTETKPTQKHSESEHQSHHENGDSKSMTSMIQTPASSRESTSEQDSEKTSKARTLSPSQFNRLSSYFHNLESKTKTRPAAAIETKRAKRPVKDVTGTAKDEVPDIMPEMKNSEFLKHIKGILLDDGKMVPLKGKQAEVRIYSFV